jgi:hypothetical protein
MAMTIVERARNVIGGVDTHLDVHVAAALDPIGGVLGVESFVAAPRGYKAMLEWMGAFGTVSKVGVEGTGAYGAGLGRFLAKAGIEVVEVDRPNRQVRRTRQVGPGRRRRGGPSRALRASNRRTQVPRRQRRGHSGAARGQALSPRRTRSDTGHYQSASCCIVG